MKARFEVGADISPVLLDIIEEQYPDVGIDGNLLSFRSRDHYLRVSSDLENTFGELLKFTEIKEAP